MGWGIRLLVFEGVMGTVVGGVGTVGDAVVLPWLPDRDRLKALGGAMADAAIWPVLFDKDDPGMGRLVLLGVIPFWAIKLGELGSAKVPPARGLRRPPAATTTGRVRG